LNGYRGNFSLILQLGFLLGGGVLYLLEEGTKEWKGFRSLFHAKRRKMAGGSVFLPAEKRKRRGPKKKGEPRASSFTE